MAGNNEKKQFITPPEDVLEPVELLEGRERVNEDCLVKRTLRIMETETGELYINPDTQHIDQLQTPSDIIRIYSREIQALRQIVTLLMALCTHQLEISKEMSVNGVSGSIYDKVMNYLQNASWELTLINDPRAGNPPPG